MDKILSMIRLGYSIKLYKEIGHLKIEVRREVKGEGCSVPYYIEQVLPMDEGHFNESKINDCLSYCEKQIQLYIDDMKTLGL